MGRRSSAALLPLRTVCAANEHREHLAILDAGVVEQLEVVAEGEAVQEEVLRVGGEAGLCLHKALEVLHRQARR